MKQQLIWYFSMQGLGVVVLGAWVWMLSGDVRELRKQVADCNTEKTDILKQQNTRLESTLLDIRNYMYQPQNLIRNGKN